MVSRVLFYAHALRRIQITTADTRNYATSTNELYCTSQLKKISKNVHKLLVITIMVALQGMCLPLPACSLEGAGSPDATRPKPRSKKRKPITVDRGSSPVLLQGVEILVHGHPYVPVSSAAMTTTTTSSKADSVAVAKAPVPGPPRRLSSQHRASNGAPAVSLLPPTVSADVSAAAPVVQGDTASASSEPIHEPLPLAQCDLDTASAILYPAL